MSNKDERQLSLDLSVPDVRKSKRTDEKAECTEAESARIRSLSEARFVKERKESARHFREILKLARHF